MIKEREEAIQLLTMDPKVWGKLLTLHRRGYDDVEALRDRISLRRSAGKGPKVGSHENRSLRRRKSIFGVPSSIGGNIWEYIMVELGLEGLRGAHKPGGAPLGLVAAS